MNVDDQRHAGQSEVKISRPATPDLVSVHHVQAGRIGQREVLIGVPSQQLSRGHLLGCADGRDLQRFHVLDHGEKLKRAGTVIAAEKPCVSFCNHERRGQQRGGFGKQPAKEGVVRVRTVGKGNQCRGIDIRLRTYP